MGLPMAPIPIARPLIPTLVTFLQRTLLLLNDVADVADFPAFIYIYYFQPPSHQKRHPKE